MASTYTTNLGIEKIATGEQSGTWGDTTNTNLDLLDEAINGIITITAASAGSSGSPNTLPITDGSSSNGRNKFIEITDGGDLGGDVFYQLTPNDAEKILFVRNNLTTQDLILFQGTYNASNDIVIPNGKDMLVKFDGAGASATVTDVFNDLNVTGFTSSSVDINGGAIDGTNIGSASAGTGNFSTLSIGGSAVTSTAAELNLNDGATAGTVVNSKTVVYGASGEVNATTLQIGGSSITSTAAELNILDGVTATFTELNYNDITTLGTSEASKVVTADANGDITIAGANYNVVWDKSADALEFGDNAKAVFGAGDDLQIYHDGSNSQIRDLGTGDLYIQASAAVNFTNTNASETYAVLNENGAVTLYYDNNAKIATTSSGIDVTGTAVTDGLTVAGTSLVQQTKEKMTISATAATGTINYDALTQAVLYYTTDASANWTVNVRGDGSNTLNSIMSIGEALTVVFLVTQGSTAYYNSAFQVDGSSVTPNWQGGSAPTEGTASGIDAYTYNIIKTGDAAFTVLASVVDFS